MALSSVCTVSMSKFAKKLTECGKICPKSNKLGTWLKLVKILILLHFLKKKSISNIMLLVQCVKSEGQFDSFYFF